MPFVVTMMLADSAEAVDNKLYILGGGWSVTGPDPTPSAVAVLIKIPWEMANEEHTMLLELQTAAGDPVLLETPVGQQAARVENVFEVGRPPGVRAGTPFTIAMALNLGPLPLPPGGAYVWKLSIDGDSHELWTLPFTTRELMPVPMAPPRPG